MDSLGNTLCIMHTKVTQVYLLDVLRCKKNFNFTYKMTGNEYTFRNTVVLKSWADTTGQLTVDRYAESARDNYMLSITETVNNNPFINFCPSNWKINNKNINWQTLDCKCEITRSTAFKGHGDEYYATNYVNATFTIKLVLREVL